MSRTVFPDIDYTSIDYEGLRNDMIECIRRRIPEYTDFSESDFGVVMAELFAHGLDVMSYYVDRHANEMFLVTCKDRKSALKIAQQMSYTPRQATPAKFYQVFSVDESDTGYLIPKGLKVKTEESTTEPQITYEVESDFLMPANVTGLEKDANDEYLYKVPIVQGATITREILGTSDGTAGQEFQLGYEPVILDTLNVEVFENGRYYTWTQVEDFLDSKDTDRHYTVSVDEYDTATIKFGNGVNGMIPNTYENGIVATYRVGGGTFGNVSANKITVLSTSITGINSTFNPSTAYEEGTDRESLEEIKRNIPISVRTLDRAVTLDDFSELSLLTGDVYSANTVKTGVLDVTVYVIPKDPVISGGSIVLDADLQAELTQYLQDRCMVGCTATVTAATVKSVDVTVRYRPTNTVYQNDVQQAISDLIHTKMDIGSMGVGEELVLSDIVSDMTNTETGISNLRSVMITSPASDVAPEDDEVIVLGTLTLEVF